MQMVGTIFVLATALPLVVASNPGPPRHRIYDREEEGLVKTSILFCVFTHNSRVSKISTWNCEPRVAFSSLFFTVKTSMCRPVPAALFKYKQKVKPSSSTPRQVSLPGKEIDEHFLIQVIDFLAQNLQSAQSEMFFLPLFLVYFYLYFFLLHVFQSGKHQSPVCGSRGEYQFCTRSIEQSAAQICLLSFRLKESIFSPNNVSAPKYVPGHAEDMLSLPWWQQTQKCRRSFPCTNFWLVFLDLADKDEVWSS